MKKYFFVFCSLFLGFIFPSCIAGATVNDFPVVYNFPTDGNYSVLELDNPISELDNIISISTLSDVVTSVPTPQAFIDFKAAHTSWVEMYYIVPSANKVYHYINEFDNYTDLVLFDYTYNGKTAKALKRSTGTMTSLGLTYSHDLNGKNISSVTNGNFTKGDFWIIHGDYLSSSNTEFKYQLVAYSNLRFANNVDGGIDDLLPIPPSMEDEGNLGYKFIYPLDGESINLHANENSNYFKVPFKVDVKNFYAFSTSKAEEDIKNTFAINDYKTEVTNITWFDKPGWLGGECRYTVEGYFYIPVSALNNVATVLTCSMWYPKSDTVWVADEITVHLTSDGSIPEYTPPSSGSDGGNINVGGNNIDGLPSAPVDGSVTDWLEYIGNLIFWLITYPFKLLGNIVTTLMSYITNMFNILQPATDQLNNVLSFIPKDILNVCWGFLSFTMLYSVLKSAFKMIRG